MAAFINVDNKGCNPKGLFLEVSTTEYHGMYFQATLLRIAPKFRDGSSSIVLSSI